MATHIKTIKNENGDTIDIVVNIRETSGYTGATPCHFIEIADVRIKRFKKRAWENIGQAISEDYSYRKIPFGTEERNIYMMGIFLQYITPEQAKAAIMEAYEAIKPDMHIIDIAAERLKEGGGQA